MMIGKTRRATRAVTCLLTLTAISACDADLDQATVDDVDDGDGAPSSDHAGDTGGEEHEPPREQATATADAGELGLLASQPELETTMLVGANAHHRVYYGTCEPNSDCATEIPMTGAASSLFRELDTVMRQYMKTHCVGGSTMALARHDRRVYKRGFGRTQGAASNLSLCTNDDFDAGGTFMTPDTPLMMGSVTKWVTATIVRKLVQRRIDERDAANIIDKTVYPYTDPTAVKIFDRDLGLLPEHVIRYFDHSGGSGTYDCPPVAYGTLTCPHIEGGIGNNRASTQCPNGTSPDERWLDVTVGDLIAHTGGLPREAPAWFDIVQQSAKTRSNTTKQHWQDEHNHLASITQWPAALSAARNTVAATLGGGVSASDVMFIDAYNSLDDRHSFDESLQAVASMCLRYSPLENDETVALDGDDLPASIQASGGSYSNIGYDILGRIAAHLNAELDDGHERMGAVTGFPETHADSALGCFLEAEQLERGVTSEHAVFHRQIGYAPGYADPIPAERRSWNDSLDLYYWENDSVMRPFCVWDAVASECSFDEWTSNLDDLGFDWSFQDQPVPFHRNGAGFGASRSVGAGALAGEAPALLWLLRDYFPREGSVYQGRPRSTLASCPVGSQCGTGWKSGGLPGGRAWVASYDGDQNWTMNLPDDDVNGRLQIETDASQWVSHQHDDPTDVHLVMMINQDISEQGAVVNGKWDPDGDPGAFDVYGRYALATDTGLIDWAAVDRMIDNQQRSVVGMTRQTNGFWYFYESDNQFDDRDEVARYWAGSPGASFGDTTPDSTWTYELPATRIGTDVVAVAMRNEVGVDPMYAWYSDGRYSTGVSSGSNWELGGLNSSAGTYTLPSASIGSPIAIFRPLTYDELISVSFNNVGSAYSWYVTGHRARGTADDLGADWVSTYTVHPEQTFGEIESIAIDWTDSDKVWTRYRDGSMSVGSSSDLDSIGYYRAAPIAMDIASGVTTLYYANGWSRSFSGTPDAIHDASNQVSSGFYNRGGSWGAYQTPEEVVAIGGNGTVGSIYYTDVNGSGYLGADFVSGTPGSTFTVSFPTGESPTTLIDTGITAGGTTYAWYTSGKRSTGSKTAPGSGGSVIYSVPPGLSYTDIAAMAIGPNHANGTVWAIYSNGVVTRGTSTNLGVDVFLP